MVLETIAGGLMGGVFRLAPEVLKIFTKKTDNSHEMAMMKLEMDFARLRGEQVMHQTEAQMTVAELDTIGQAFREQSATAQAAGKFVSALSALVRPLVTYWFVMLYSAVKIASMTMAFQAGADWKEVLVSNWADQDMAILMMILTFWFVGRVYEKYKR